MSYEVLIFAFSLLSVFLGITAFKGMGGVREEGGHRSFQAPKKLRMCGLRCGNKGRRWHGHGGEFLGGAGDGGKWEYGMGVGDPSTTGGKNVGIWDGYERSLLC